MAYALLLTAFAVVVTQAQQLVYSKAKVVVTQAQQLVYSKAEGIRRMAFGFSKTFIIGGSKKINKLKGLLLSQPLKKKKEL